MQPRLLSYALVALLAPFGVVHAEPVQEAAPSASGSSANKGSPAKSGKPNLTKPARAALAPTLAMPVVVRDAAQAPAREAQVGQASAKEGSVTEAKPEESADEKLLREAMASSETIVMRARNGVQTGSGQTLDEEQLERWENNDIHRVLRTVPGVNIREEDGYGLRPNIGIRGTGSERSSKIALLEDGVLIAPAPYSAPAAYYFPLVTRMKRIEVVKGNIAVRHGPNTIGGAVNLVGNDIPHERVATVDLATGNNLYGKAHMQAGDVGKHWGFWIEGVKLHSDGFKVLDNGGDTGFDKNDGVARFRVNSDPDQSGYQELTLSVGYSDEVSNETYTGLSDSDFSLTPNRRYAATQLDRMDWQHQKYQLRHKIELGTSWDLSTTLYHHRFDRDWRKLDGFSGGRALEDVLANPDGGINRIFYNLLTGQGDTASDSERLYLGTNSRQFVSQGAQIQLHRHLKTGTVDHDLHFGLRLHMDSARRAALRDSYSMMSGTLVRDSIDTSTLTDTFAESRAWASYAQDTMQWDQLTVSAGLRVEAVATSFQNKLTPDEDPENNLFAIAIPGAGAFYALNKHWGVLAGVHRGFIPVAPGQDPVVKPETSLAYEAGVRYGDENLRAEVIGFANDYQNLKATCSFASGCTPDMVSTEFNGYGALVAGVEAMAAGEIRSRRLPRGTSVPIAASYTFTHSSFDESFLSQNPQWGMVEKGDELPYLAKHQIGLEAGVRHGRFEFSSAVKLQSQMRDVAGQGPIPEDERVDGNAVFDLGAHVDFGNYGHLYGTVDNVLGSSYVVSRRPTGVRPGQPRLVILGYKNDW